MKEICPVKRLDKYRRLVFKMVCGALLLLNLGLILAYFNLKTGFHSDEQWSYAHANSTQGAYLNKDMDIFMTDFYQKVGYQWLAGSVFQHYLTVQDTERFRYGHIWENLAKDVHPPLYFILLHTVCSFFPDVFSKWHGAVINIVFWLLTLWMMFKLSKRFFDDDKMAVLPVVAFAFSQLGFNMVLYLRMYVMQTFFAVGLMYEMICMLQENKADKKRLFMIFLYAALGNLTQYNALVFAFFMAVGAGLVLLKRKNWLLLGVLAEVMCLSVAVLFLVFPAAADILLHSPRGVEISDKISHFSNVALFLEEPLAYLLKIYLCEFLSFPQPYIKGLILCVVFGGAVLFEAGCQRAKNMGVMVGVCLLTGVSLAVLMPLMHQFFSRYFMMLMPMLAIATVYFIKEILCCLRQPARWCFVLISVLIAVNSWNGDFAEKSAYRFQNNPATEDYIQRVKGRDVVISVSYPSFLYGQSGVFMNAKRVLVVADDCLPHTLKMIENARGGVFLTENIHAGRCMDCVPERALLKCPELAQNLQFVSTVRYNEIYFDLYEIK